MDADGRGQCLVAPHLRADVDDLADEEADAAVGSAHARDRQVSPGVVPSGRRKRLVRRYVSRQPCRISSNSPLLVVDVLRKCQAAQEHAMSWWGSHREHAQRVVDPHQSTVGGGYGHAHGRTVHDEVEEHPALHEGRPEPSPGR